MQTASGRRSGAVCGEKSPKTRLARTECYHNSRLTVMVTLYIDLGPIQTLLHSCAEPNLSKFDFGATVDSDGVRVLNLIRQTMQNKTCRVENSTFLYK